MDEEQRFREAREKITGDSWLDDLARASLSAAEAKFSAPSEAVTAVVAICPDGHKAGKIVTGILEALHAGWRRVRQR